MKQFKSWLGCVCLLAAASLQGAVTWGSAAVVDASDDAETAVNVTAGATLPLGGVNSFPSARLTLGDNVKLVLAEGYESAVVQVKDLTVGAGCTIGEGVTILGDFVSDTVKGKTLVVDGCIKSTTEAGTFYSNNGRSYVTGTGTIWVDNLTVRNDVKVAATDSRAGLLSFTGIRLNLRGTASTKSIVDRHYGFILFTDVTVGFWGKDPKWERKPEGLRSTVLSGMVTFDTLDAEDGVTPRTFTWSANTEQPTGSGKVRKVGAGTMVVQFSPAWTGGTSVEEGTLRFTGDAVTINQPTSVLGEDAVLDLPAPTTFTDGLVVSNALVTLPATPNLTVGGALSVGGNARIAFPLSEIAQLKVDELAFLDNASTLTFELDIPEALPCAAYTLLECANVTPASAARFAVTVPEGLPEGMQGELAVTDGVVRYMVTASPCTLERAVWTGQGASAVWSVGANWNILDVPQPGFPLVFAGGTAVTNVNNLGEWSAGSITFAGNSAFSLGGEDTLTVNNAIVSQSAATQTFDMPVSFAATAAQLEQAAGTTGSLAFKKSLTAPGTLTVAGPAQVAFDGAATVNGNLTATGASTLGGTGSLAVTGGMVMQTTSLSLGVASTHVAGNLALKGKNYKLNFSSGTTAIDGQVSMSSTCQNATFTIDPDATFRIGTMTSSYSYSVVCNGVFEIGELFTVGPNSGSTKINWLSGTGTANLKKIVLDKKSQNTHISVSRLNVGSGGVTVGDAGDKKTPRKSSLHFGEAATTIRPCDADYQWVDRGCNLGCASFDGTAQKGTTTILHTVDTNGVARTVTFELELEGAGAFEVDGAGTFVLTPRTATSFTGVVGVREDATLKLKKSLAAAAKAEVKSGGCFLVDAAELTLPQTVEVAERGKLAFQFAATVPGLDMKGDSTLKPVRASKADVMPVLTVTEQVSVDGTINLDLSESFVSGRWEKVVDWQAVGCPEGVTADNIMVAVGADDQTTYCVRVDSEGIFVSTSGFVILVR